MKSLGIICKIRKPKRVKESKNTDVLIHDLVNRDYNNKFHKEHIIETDISCIKAPVDVFSNNVYLFVTIINIKKSYLKAF